jgi:hypothetical protein
MENVTRLQHGAKELFLDAGLLPGLKVFMQHAAENTEPIFVNRLSACSQTAVPLTGFLALVATCL